MIKSLTLRNVQSHKFTKIEFPKIGTVRICGANSSGKTALFKPLYKFIENRLHIKEERENLINNESNKMVYTIEFHNGYIVNLSIQSELKNCEVVLQRISGEQVFRPISVEVINSILTEIGLHYDTERDVSLHFHKTFNPPLFLCTNGVTNYDILSLSLSDINAINAEETLTNLLEEWILIQKNNTQELQLIEAQLSTMIFLDEEIEQKRLNELSYLRNALTKITAPNYLIEIPTIPFIFSINFSHIPINLISSLSILLSYEIVASLILPCHIIHATLNFVKFMKSIENELCPTCGGVISWKNEFYI